MAGKGAQNVFLHELKIIVAHQSLRLRKAFIYQIFQIHEWCPSANPALHSHVKDVLTRLINYLKRLGKSLSNLSLLPNSSFLSH